MNKLVSLNISLKCNIVLYCDRRIAGVVPPKPQPDTEIDPEDDGAMDVAMLQRANVAMEGLGLTEDEQNIFKSGFEAGVEYANELKSEKRSRDSGYESR